VTSRPPYGPATGSVAVPRRGGHHGGHAGPSALMARMLKLLLTVSLAQTGLTVTLVVALQR